MRNFTIMRDSTARDLVAAAYESDDPVVVFDGEDECMVVMAPATFERFLFESEQIAQVPRFALRL